MKGIYFWKNFITYLYITLANEEYLFWKNFITYFYITLTNKEYLFSVMIYENYNFSIYVFFKSMNNTSTRLQLKNVNVYVCKTYNEHRWRIFTNMDEEKNVQDLQWT